MIMDPTPPKFEDVPRTPFECIDRAYVWKDYADERKVDAIIFALVVVFAFAAFGYGMAIHSTVLLALGAFNALSYALLCSVAGSASHMADGYFLDWHELSGVGTV